MRTETFHTSSRCSPLRLVPLVPALPPPTPPLFMTGSLRAKVKRAFTRQGARGSDSSQEKKSKKSTDEWPDNVYKPGEPMPKPKYRAPVNRQHQAKLSAFSFADAWNRRSSEQSQYSPRGSRLPSAVNSLRRKSLRPGLRSRRASAADGRLDENVDRDDDVGNGALLGIFYFFLLANCMVLGFSPVRYMVSDFLVLYLSTFPFFCRRKKKNTGGEEQENFLFVSSIPPPFLSPSKKRARNPTLTPTPPKKQ